MKLDAFLAAVRKNCRPGTWSSGVTLSREGAVAQQSRDDEEIVLRVRDKGRAVAPTVVLYPGEREWDCDCGSRISPCEHIAAAAIAIGSGEIAEAAVPQAKTAWGRIAYRFSRAEGGLRVRRSILREGQETPLEQTLSSYLSKPALAGTVQPEQHDLAADGLLQSAARGTLPPTKLDALLRVLAGAENVSLDGAEVTVTSEEVLPEARIVDQGPGVVVHILPDPRVAEVLSPGVGLCRDGVIARLGELELCGAWLQNLPIVRPYGPGQIGEVVASVLPDLSRRMLVEVRSARLPRVDRSLEPRVVIELRHVGATLTALPTLVYGQPPCVRIDGSKMVFLRGSVPVRDEEQERRLIQRLRDELNLMCGHLARFEGKDAAVFAEKLRGWRGSLTGDAANVVKSNLRLVPQMSWRPMLAPLAPGSAAASELPPVAFDLRFEVAGAESGKGQAVDALAVVRAWQEGLGLVPLDGGGWAPLPLSWLAKHGQLVSDLLEAREKDGRLANHALPALGRLCAELETPPPPGLERLAPLLGDFAGLPAAALPPDLTATLRPYQQKGVDWLFFLRRAALGGILADDMGLGKTLQALCAMRAKEKTLVVCPTSVLPNWQNELERFRPGLKVAVFHGPKRTWDESADVVLTTYAILRLDLGRLTTTAEGKPRRYALVVLDEAQAIKNPDSQAARAAFSLEADTRLALSGTPVENRLEELWSLMHFSNRGLLGGRRSFEDRFARPIAQGAPEAGQALRARIRPFVLRRHKRDVAPELPPRSMAVMRVALEERERQIYDAVRAASRADVLALLERGGGVMKALEALLRLRQAACHPALLPGQTAKTSSKVERLCMALETAAADGHKALVFSQWTSLLDLIEPRLEESGLSFLRLDGSTQNRAEVVDGFQNEAGPPILLVSLKAGGVGLNLTAADHVFLCDPWWNPAVEDQAADRAHRIGQDKPVFIYRLVAEGTVEERILVLQESKRALFDAALGDAGAAASLSREDLLALLD